MNELTLDLPDGWQDKSVHILSSPGESPEVTLVVNRDQPNAGEDLEGYVTRQIKQMTTELPGFRLLGLEEATIGGQPATHARIAWRPKQGEMFQSQMFMLRPGGNVLILTASASTQTPGKGEELKALLASVVFRGEV